MRRDFAIGKGYIGTFSGLPGLKRQEHNKWGK